MLARPDVLRIVAKLGDEAGARNGTAFLVALRAEKGPQAILLTALHNVARVSVAADADDPVVTWAAMIKCAFRPRVGEGYGESEFLELKRIAWSSWADWVAFEVVAPDGARRFELPGSAERKFQPGQFWSGYGFPSSEELSDGVGVDGTVVTLSTARRRRIGNAERVLDHIELRSPQLGAGQPRAARGYSGGPVVVDDLVVGVLLTRDPVVDDVGPLAGTARGGTVYALPIEHVRVALLEHGYELAIATERGLTEKEAFDRAQSRRLAELEDDRKEKLLEGDDIGDVLGAIRDARRELRQGPPLRPGELLSERYELRKRVAMGGFAEVWKAYDELEKKVVAVKVLHWQWSEDQSRVERFAKGARRLAELQHPAVVRLLGGLQRAGHRYYYVMEYLKGGDLRKAMATGVLDRNGALAAVGRALEGLAFAHEQGIVHRDVKPGNILVDAEGRGWIADFDLARARTSSHGTRTGGLGTFVYAAPEQHRKASQVDARADVYSAGMTVIYALTGEDPPLVVARTEPDLFERLPCGDNLSKAVRSAVAYSAVDRAVTSKQLAEFVRAELAEKTAEPSRSPVVPIPPRRQSGSVPDVPSWSERKWVRVAGLTAASVGVLGLGGLVAVLVLGDGPGSDADGGRLKDDQDATRESEPNLYAIANQAAVDAQALAEDDPRTASLMAAVALHIVADTKVVAGSDPERALRIALGQTRGRELVDESNAGNGGPVPAVAISPDGRKVIATTGKDAKIWDVSEGAEKPVYLRGHQSTIEIAAASPDGRWLVTAAQDRTIRLWNLQAEDPSTDARILREHKGKVTSIDFSTDGRWMVSSGEDGRPRIWDLHAANPANPTGSLSGHEGAITDVAIAADGSAVYTASDDNTAKIWPLANGKAGRSTRLSAHEMPILAIDVSNDGHWLITASQDQSARMWDLTSPAPWRNSIELLGHKGPVNHIEISPDSKLAVTASSDNTLKIWELDAKDPAATGVTFSEGHSEGINELLVDPSSRWAVTAGKDAKVIAWNLDRRNLVVESIAFPGHTGDAGAIALSADGRWLVSGSADGNAFVWDYQGSSLSSNANYFPARAHTRAIADVDVSRDGKRFLTAGYDNKAVLWEFEPSGRPFPRDHLRGHERHLNAAALAPGGRWAATAGRDQSVFLWDIVKSNPSESVKRLEGHEGEVTDLLFSSDGAWLFSSSTDKSVRAWKADKDWEDTPLLGHTFEVVRLAISRDNEFLVSADVVGQLRTWDLGASLGDSKQQFRPHQQEIWAIVFSDDGKWMLTGSADRNAVLWTIGKDGLSGKGTELRGHADTINTAAFSLDGHWAATGSRDGTVRLWDISSKHPDENARTFEMTDSTGVEWVLFGPDSKRLYTGNGDGSVHIWYLEPVVGRDNHQVLKGHEKKISAMAMPIDGRFLITASYDGTARVWPMAVPEMIRLACYASGRSPTEAEWTKWVPGFEYEPICD